MLGTPRKGVREEAKRVTDKTDERINEEDDHDHPEG
jgi:hypothetical protein